MGHWTLNSKEAEDHKSPGKLKKDIVTTARIHKGIGAQPGRPEEDRLNHHVFSPLNMKIEGTTIKV